MPPAVPLKYRVARCASFTRALAVMGGALLLAALAAPWVYQLAQHVPVLAAFPFRRVFNRTVMVLVIGGLVVCWRWLGISFHPRSLFRRKRTAARYFTWLALGTFCITLLVLAQVYSGLRIYRHPAVSVVLQNAVVGLFSAVCVGVVEELIFRGFLLHALAERMTRYRALIISSAVFACLHLFSLDHFLRPIKNVQVDGTQWDAGLRLLGLFFVPLREPQVVVPGVIGLFFAGWLLAELTLRSRTLWAAMGLHTGWVFAIKALGKLWKYPEPPLAGAGPTWLYGEKYAATGVLGWLVVIILILIVNGLAMYAVYRLVERVVRLVPRVRLMHLGRVLGRLAFRVARAKRRIALNNVCAAFPEKSSEACTAIARQSFETLGMLAMEMLDFPRLRQHYFDYVHFTGLEYIDAVHARGQAVVFFTAHFGNWEIFPLTCGLRGYPFSGVARPFHNEWIYRHIVQLRCVNGVRILDKHDIIAEVLQRLRANEMVGFVGDQHAGAHGLPTLFFGRPASTSPAMAAFARKTGAALIVVFDHMRPDGTHEPFVYPPFEVPCTPDSAHDIADATQRLMSMLEAEIRRDPGQWLWMHRKWRDTHAAR